MPIIKSAKKRMRQNERRRKRNYVMRSKLRTYIRNATTLIKEKKTDEAVKAVSVAYSVIDTACKKNLLHPNTASRKKSFLARNLNELQGSKAKSEKTETKS